MLLSGVFVVNLHRERGKSVVGNTSGLTKRSKGEAINDAGYASIIDGEEWLRPLGDEGRRCAGVEVFERMRASNGLNSCKEA